MVRRAIPSILALACLAAAPAAAQDEQARARQLFEQGVTAMDAGNLGAATRSFQQSYQLYPRASTACNMALALERSGRACDAHSWYRQCAALDTAGRFRDHANRQAAALQRQCPRTTQAPNPFVTGPRVRARSVQGVQVMETAGSNPHVYRRSFDHTLLGLGIGGLVLGTGGLVGGGLSAGEATDQALSISAVPSMDPGNPTLLAEGTPDADAYNRASTFRNLAIGLYVAGGILSGIGAILIIVDLARPGVFAGGARRPTGPYLTLRPQPGGGVVGQFALGF